MLIFRKYKYLHIKIASLGNVKSCVTVGPISLVVNVWSCMATARLVSAWKRLGVKTTQVADSHVARQAAS